MRQSIDLNSDIGESFGAWKMGDDSRLMNVVSSVNIACGFHAGDPSTIRQTILTAMEKGVALGAHPGYPDLQGFGRREMELSAQEIFDSVLYQTAALKGMCEALGGKLRHVKPHGALYNSAAKNGEKAAAIAEAVRALDEKLILYGLAGSCLISEAERVGLKTAGEVFADRTYQADGSLTPRRQPNALIDSTEKACVQVLQMIREEAVMTVDGRTVPVKAETVCIHGDGSHALEFALALRRRLTENGLTIKSFQ